MTAVRKDQLPSYSNVMTVDRLRARLFGGSQVPFWNFDPKNITVGIEVEYFIAHVQPDGFALASKHQYLNVIEFLKRNSAYTDKNLLDQPGRVSKDTPWGFIVIKPDFAWHILEISFPPRRTIDELRTLFQSTLAEVDAALSHHHLQRLDLSCLPNAPKQMDLVELDRLASSVDRMRQSVRDKPTTDPYFPAYIAATHVHLNTSNEQSLSLLPKLYELEPLAMEMFSRAKSFEGKTFKNLRTTFCDENLGEKYLLKTIPKKPPASIADLVDAMNSSPQLFPNDPFFGARDMSYIRPTKYGTLEFRSACSYFEVDDLIEVAIWRKIQMVAAHTSFTEGKSIKNALSEAIAAVCGGNYPPNLIKRINEARFSLVKSDGA